MLVSKIAGIRTGLLFLVLSVFSFSPLSGQDDASTVFLMFDFMKSEPGVDYVEFEEKYWQPIHEERKRRGLIADWFVMGVQYPSGDMAEYNYVTVTVFSDYKKLENPFPDYADIIATVHPGMDMAKLDEKTNRARSWVKSELFHSIDKATPSDMEGAPEWVMVNFMQVDEGGGYEYVNMELEYYKPIHQAHIDAGKLDDWFLLGRGMPYGTDYDYQFITIDAYGSWDNVFAPGIEDVWESVHPDVDPNEVWEKMAAARSLIRGELWHLELGTD
ncbi:MAG: hypothetical protein GYB31_04265 [Bacteroidetes bacterium]|nr:hypothetical protein [Bacteroidota bacterium]